MAGSKARFKELNTMNAETDREVKRISLMTDPLQMMKDKKDADREKYMQIKDRIS